MALRGKIGKIDNSGLNATQTLLNIAATTKGILKDITFYYDDTSPTASLKITIDGNVELDMVISSVVAAIGGVDANGLTPPYVINNGPMASSSQNNNTLFVYQGQIRFMLPFQSSCLVEITGPTNATINALATAAIEV